MPAGDRGETAGLARPDRYGRPRRTARPGVRRALAVIGIALAVGVTALAWQLSRPAVEVGVVSIRFVSDHRVDVTFEVHKPRTKTAVCVVRARDASGAQAGYAEVTVGADRSVVTRTYALRTGRRAVTGEVPACRLRP